MACKEALLCGRRHRHEQQVGAGGGDPPRDLPVVLRGEVAVVRARDHRTGIAAGYRDGGARQHVLAGSEQEHPVAAGRRDGQQRLHQVDAAHARGHREPEQPRAPHDPLPVRGHDVEAPEDVAQLVVALQPGHHGGVERRGGTRHSGRDRLAGDAQRLLDRERVDRRAEELEPTWPFRLFPSHSASLSVVLVERIACSYLASVHDSGRQLFPVTTTLADGRYASCFEPYADALRYSITCLLGLQAATGGQEDRIGAFAERHAEAVERPSDAGLLLMLMPAARLADRARATLAADRGRLNVQDLSWMLWGAVTAARAGVRGAESLSPALYERLSGYVEDATGLPHHRPVRRRAGLVSFGAISYFLRAVHEYAVLSSAAAARALFARALRSTLRVQQPDGGWPWLLHAPTGAVVERYPLYTVHQLSMSLLFLVPALDAGVLADDGAVERSVAWAHGANELGVPMVAAEPGFMARAIERRDPCQRAQRYARAAAARAGCRERRAAAHTLRLNRVSHSYEWGWLLFARAEARYAAAL